MQIACHLNSYYSEISVSDIASDWSSNRHIIRMVVGHVQVINSVSDVSSDWLSDRYMPTGDTRFVVLYIYTCNANRVPLVR